MNKKFTLVKQAAFLTIADAIVIISQIILLVKRQLPLNPEDYLAPIPLPTFILSLTLVALLMVFVLTVVFAVNTEKEDELSKLNKYKAGYISKYIVVAIVIATIWIMQDFRFAFSGDFMDNISLPLIFVMLAQLVENIVFIILEKNNLE